MPKFLKTALTTGAALAFSTSLASADQVFNDDVIITQSLCVGNDCVNGESFGFDTIRLKENNVRIKFEDTSNSASFATNDWQLTANDSANGGANKFSLDDITNSKTPFTVLANAPSNALFIDANGDVGLTTNNPIVELHMADGDTPTIRLEQDGSSGFTAQTWDIAGNEAGFFIRDATNGSTLPFRILPGASSQALVIDGNDDVGIGAGTNPTASLHVRRTDGTAQLKIEDTNSTTTARTLAHLVNNGRPDIVMANTGSSKEWSFGAGARLIFKSGALNSTDAEKTKQFELFDNGNATLTGTLTTGGGTCGGGCDLVFTEEYDLPSIKEHAKKMYELGYLPNVGPTKEGAPINVSDKLGRMLNELEHAHIYIDTLHRENEAQKAAINALTARLDALESASK